MNNLNLPKPYVNDKYDDAIEALHDSTPQEIIEVWTSSTPYTEKDNLLPGWELFQSVGPKGCGCLTQVKYEEWNCGDDDLKEQILDDDNIPNPYDMHRVLLEEIPLGCTAEDMPSPIEGIPSSSLQVFAEYQRKIDALNIR